MFSQEATLGTFFIDFWLFLRSNIDKQMRKKGVQNMANKKLFFLSIFTRYLSSKWDPKSSKSRPQIEQGIQRSAKRFLECPGTPKSASQNPFWDDFGSLSGRFFVWNLGHIWDAVSFASFIFSLSCLHFSSPPLCSLLGLYGLALLWLGRPRPRLIDR